MSTTSHSHDESAFTPVIDDRRFSVSDPIWNGRQLLELADKRPAEEHLIYRIGPHNLLDDLGLEETVDLRHSEAERFLTFRSDRSFRFELNGQREDWGAPKISEANLRKLASAGDDHSIWFEQRDGKERELARGELVDLTDAGVERFHSELRLIVKIINENNGVDFVLHARRKTPIRVLLERMYENLGLTRQQDDRLRCKEDGSDVFQFADLTLGEYLGANHCCLIWLFAGGTGGAACR